MAFVNAKIFGDFYSPERVLSYGRPWIFSVGSRSIGKSTGFAIYMIKRYLKEGSKFIYVRRTEDEVQNTCKSFFSTAIQILKDNGEDIEDFKYENKDYYIKLTGEEEYKQCGTVVPLSQEQKYKSRNFSEYNTIIYDEFISRDPNRYLGNKDNRLFEYDCALSLYQTVDRGIGQSYQNDTIFIFTANNSSYYNPIFMALGIDEYLRTDTKICAPKGKLWIVEQTTSVKGTETIKDSYGYKLSDEKNKAYAYENIGFDAHMNFVEKVDKPMRGLINLKYNGHVMGVYTVDSEGIVYICNKPTETFTIALTAGDQDKVNYMLATRYHDSYFMKTIRDAYYSGFVRFETNKCRYEISNYFMLTP